MNENKFDSSIIDVKTIERVNLKSYGYEMAGISRGNIQNLNSYLEKIRLGSIVDEQAKLGLGEEEIRQIDIEIENKLSNKEEKLNKIKSIENIEIPEKESKKADLNEVIEKIKSKIITGVQISYPLFGVYLLVFIILSVYLFLFYLVILYDALAGHISAEIIPDPKTFKEALSYNPMLIVAPIFAVALGIAIHFFLDLKKSVVFKVIAIGAVVLVNLIFDFIISFKIYQNLADNNLLLNIPTDPWFKSPNFWIVIIMGFGAYILWSIIFQAIFQEWDKFDSKKWERGKIENIDKKITILDDEIFTLKSLMRNELPNEIAKIETEINKLNLRKVNPKVSINSMLNWINEFGIGWLQYLVLDSHTEQRVLCSEHIENYKNQLLKNATNE